MFNMAHKATVAKNYESWSISLERIYLTLQLFRSCRNNTRDVLFVIYWYYKNMCYNYDENN